MRTIKLLDTDDVKVFDEIATAKREPRGRRLRTARTKVLAAYQNYEKAVPEVGNLPAVQLTKYQRASLIHAFEVETAPMATLRGQLLLRVASARCPFCGIGESSTLDHYLPKELNPQFAIFPKNLVPCCSPCNTRKRDKVLDKNTNVRCFIHPYYDQIPINLFMKVRIRLMPNALVLHYQLTKPENMSDATFSHLSLHFKHLNLANRYQLMALTNLRDMHGTFKRRYGVNKDAGRVSAELIEKAEDLESLYGCNDWLVILYRALASNTEFCDGGFNVLTQIQ